MPGLADIPALEIGSSLSVCASPIRGVPAVPSAAGGHGLVRWADARARGAGCRQLLALFDRSQARDFVDVAALVERFGFDQLCQLAEEKDRGFSLSVLRDMLGGFDRFSRAEFGLDEAAYAQLAQQVARWRAGL